MAAKRILLVDDDEDFLKVMRMRLTSWGYDVFTASKGEEAVFLARRNRGVLDAVILDIVMEGMDGVETLKRIRRFDKNIPAFMLTAYADDKSFARAQKLGIRGFIHKSGRDDIARAVQTVLKNIKRKK